MRTRIIINADDFGMSSPVNEAVFKATSEGILSSATIMANMPGFEEAVQIAKALPKLGVGIHLNLFRGQPLSPSSSIPTLLTKQGRLLRSYAALYKRWFLRELSLGEIEIECRAQIERVIASGLWPTHLDSEKHFHLFFRPARAIIMKLAKRYGIKAIRAIDEEPLRMTGLRPPSWKRRLIASALSRKGRTFRSSARAQGIQTADHFFGVAYTGAMFAEVLLAHFSHLQDGTIEVMSHPATTTNATELIGERSWVDAARVGEYRALLDPHVRAALERSGAELTHYGIL